MKDLYKILGVDPECAQQIIKSAYKSKARSLHPDKPSGSTEAFQELNEAYSILRDTEKRAKYDRGESLEVKPKINQVAMARLGALFQQAIPKADDHKDMIDIIRTETANAAMKMQNDIDIFNSEIKKYKHVLDRVEYNGDGSDIFTGQVELTIASMENQISSLSDEIEVTKLVLCMLNDYTCDVKEREHVNYLSSNAAGLGATSTEWY